MEMTPIPPLGVEGDEHVGILFVTREALRDLLHGCATEAIEEAEVRNGTLRVLWRGGGETRLPWRDILASANLTHLPAPTSAFASTPQTIGLVIRSPTPCEGLPSREPHSVIQPIGTLTTGGLRAES